MTSKTRRTRSAGSLKRFQSILRRTRSSKSAAEPSSDATEQKRITGATPAIVAGAAKRKVGPKFVRLGRKSSTSIADSPNHAAAEQVGTSMSLNSSIESLPCSDSGNTDDTNYSDSFEFSLESEEGLQSGDTTDRPQLDPCGMWAKAFGFEDDHDGDEENVSFEDEDCEIKGEKGDTSCLSSPHTKKISEWLPFFSDEDKETAIESFEGDDDDYETSVIPCTQTEAVKMWRPFFSGVGEEATDEDFGEEDDDAKKVNAWLPFLSGGLEEASLIEDFSGMVEEDGSEVSDDTLEASEDDDEVHDVNKAVPQLGDGQSDLIVDDQVELVLHHGKAASANTTPGLPEYERKCTQSSSDEKNGDYVATDDMKSSSTSSAGDNADPLDFIPFGKITNVCGAWKLQSHNLCDGIKTSSKILDVGMCFPGVSSEGGTAANGERDDMLFERLRGLFEGHIYTPFGQSYEAYMKGDCTSAFSASNEKADQETAICTKTVEQPSASILVDSAAADGTADQETKPPRSRRVSPTKSIVTLNDDPFSENCSQIESKANPMKPSAKPSPINPAWALPPSNSVLQHRDVKRSNRLLTRSNPSETESKTNKASTPKIFPVLKSNIKDVPNKPNEIQLTTRVEFSDIETLQLVARRRDLCGLDDYVPRTDSEVFLDAHNPNDIIRNLDRLSTTKDETFEPCYNIDDDSIEKMAEELYSSITDEKPLFGRLGSDLSAIAKPSHSTLDPLRFVTSAGDSELDSSWEEFDSSTVFNPFNPSPKLTAISKSSAGASVAEVQSVGVDNETSNFRVSVTVNTVTNPQLSERVRQDKTECPWSLNASRVPMKGGKSPTSVASSPFCEQFEQDTPPLLG